MELNKIYNEDCLKTMSKMEPQSINCVVTSPPYWGLRDYGVDGQLGLEKTPEEYVQKMVFIFGWIKRVLKDSGTVWLNLGSSYAGSGRGPTGHNRIGDQVKRQGFSSAYDILPNQSQGDARSCDTDGTELEDSLKNDRAYSCLRDESLIDCPHHQTCIFGKYPHLLQSVLPFLQKDHDKQHLDSVVAFLDALHHASHPSTNPSLPGNDEAAFSLLNKALAFLLEYHSSFDGEKDSLNMLAYIADIFQKLLPLNCHIQDKVFSFLAYKSPFDKYNLTNTSLNFKSKDLINIPFYVAEALRQDGWYLRSDIIWSKLNPMPESVTDRPTKAHEYIFLLSKKAKYYYDADAVREEHSNSHHDGVRKEYDTKPTMGAGGVKGVAVGNHENGRNKRTVWTVTTQSYPEAHFATYPEKLIEPCILAGCPEEVCSKCGKPVERIVEKERTFESGSGKSGNMPVGKHGINLQGGGETLDIRRGPCVRSKTIGFKQTCDCNAGFKPGIVYDPFMGAGTTALVALRASRQFIGSEISADYVKIAEKRIKPFLEQYKLFT